MRPELTRTAELTLNSEWAWIRMCNLQLGARSQCAGQNRINRTVGQEYYLNFIYLERTTK